MRDNCEFQGTANFIAGGVAGSLFGLIFGVASNYKHFGKEGFSRSVFTTTISHTLSFGGFLGVYQYTKCSVYKMRKKKDVLNEILC